MFFKDFDSDLEEVLARMRDEGVYTLTVGTELKTSKESVALSEGRDGMYATVGLHPNHAKDEEFDRAEYTRLAMNPSVVAIGECGIDYFRLEGDIQEERKRQFNLFEEHIDLALERDVPLMIHARPSKGSMDAYLDIHAVISERQKSVGDKLRGNMHFFVGSIDVARMFYDIGFTTSFTGVLTFTHDYDDVVKYAPLDMILSETDAPFAAPEPFRGRRNEPAHVKYVVDAIARIRGVSERTIQAAVFENARRVFSLNS